MNDMSSNRHMLFFGYGEISHELRQRLSRDNTGGAPWQFSFAVRHVGAFKEEYGEDLDCVRFSSEEPLHDPKSVLAEVTHVVTSIPPGPKSDFVLMHHKDHLRQWGHKIDWIGYMSTTGVYGDHAGDWVTEETRPRPKTDRAIRRLRAEGDWLALGESMGITVSAFRLGGLYSITRNPILAMKRNQARRVIKENQYFSRIHIEDAAQVMQASIEKPNAGAVYNVCDDLPTEQQDPVLYAAELLGVAPPRKLILNLEKLNSVQRSFYEESRRVRNDRIKDELGVQLLYPTYKEGLRAIFEEMKEQSEE